MIRKKQEKIFCYKKILSTKNEEIGEIFLVSYFTKSKICNDYILHLEYKIYDKFADFRNKGIMTKAIADYLKYIKKYNYTRILANVKKDNIASKRVLEKNNFIKFQTINDIDVYLIDLNLNAEFMQKTMIEFLKNQEITKLEK